MNWSGLGKFLTGFTLAIALIFFTGINLTRHLISRLTAPPPRPTFPNDSPTSPPTAAPIQATPQTQPSPTPPQTNPPSPSPSPENPNAYEARVTQSIGLIVRQGPSRDTEQLGGVEYNERLTVLETSADGEWLRVRSTNAGIEGWVRAGNVERVD